MKIVNNTVKLCGKATRIVVDNSLKVAKYVAVKSVPVTQRLATNFAEGYNNKQVVLPKHPKSTSSEEPGEVGICNICEGPYVDGHCTTYKCWRQL